MTYVIVTPPNADVRAEYDTEAEARKALAAHIALHPDDNDHYIVAVES